MANRNRCILSVVAALSMVGGSSLGSSEDVLGSASKRRPPRTSAAYQVRKTVSEFISSIRREETGAVFTVYKPVESDVSAASPSEILQSSFRTFFEIHKSNSREPLVCIVAPVVSWLGDGRAKLSCELVWNVKDKSQRCRCLRVKEEFTLEQRGDGYVISEAKSTPLVITYWDRPDLLHQRLARLRGRVNQVQPSINE